MIETIEGALDKVCVWATRCVPGINAAKTELIPWIYTRVNRPILVLLQVLSKRHNRTNLKRIQIPYVEVLLELSSLAWQMPSMNLYPPPFSWISALSKL